MKKNLMTNIALTIVLALGGCNAFNAAFPTPEAKVTAAVTASCYGMTVADLAFGVWLSEQRDPTKPAILAAINQEAVAQSIFHPICAANDAGQLTTADQALAQLSAAFAKFVSTVNVAKLS